MMSPLRSAQGLALRAVARAMALSPAVFSVGVLGAPVQAEPKAQPPTPVRRQFALPFDIRYLPLFAVGMGAIVGVPATVGIGRRSGWRQLAERYPDRNAGRGRSFRSGQIVVRTTLYRMGVRFAMDESHLHVTMSALARPGHAPLSIPWSDIAASGDEWPWFPFKGEPMVRLTLAADPDLRILVKVRDAERLVAGSGGRLVVEGRAEGREGSGR